MSFCGHKEGCDCAVCEDMAVRELSKKRAADNIEAIKKTAYQSGRESLKTEMIDWLNNGFEYENSVMTVHAVREVLQRYCAK